MFLVVGAGPCRGPPPQAESCAARKPAYPAVMKTRREVKRGSGLKRTLKISVLPMITATYFMVAGGPYGLEDLIQKTGYAATLLILILTPLLWSLPTALMVSELATAIPDEGGFYIWVRRAMGRFWGFQETWLTLAGSVFEMALYPNLCIDYIGQFKPSLVEGHRGLILGFAMIALCTVKLSPGGVSRSARS